MMGGEGAVGHAAAAARGATVSMKFLKKLSYIWLKNGGVLSNHSLHLTHLHFKEVNLKFQ